MAAIPKTIDEAFEAADELRARQIEIEEMITWAQHDAALTPDGPSDLCADCGFKLTFVKQVPCGELYHCANCGLEIVRPLPFLEPMPPLTDKQWEALYRVSDDDTLFWQSM